MASPEKRVRNFRDSVATQHAVHGLSLYQHIMHLVTCITRAPQPAGLLVVLLPGQRCSSACF